MRVTVELPDSSPRGGAGPAFGNAAAELPVLTREFCQRLQGTVCAGSTDIVAANTGT